MLHARRQSTAELQQQHVDRLNRHTIHTTSAGMAHANGPTARATVNSVRGFEFEAFTVFRSAAQSLVK